MVLFGMSYSRQFRQRRIFSVAPAVALPGAKVLRPAAVCTRAEGFQVFRLLRTVCIGFVERAESSFSRPPVNIFVLFLTTARLCIPPSCLELSKIRSSRATALDSRYNPCAGTACLPRHLDSGLWTTCNDCRIG